MTILTEERIIFIFVLLSIPALVYAVEKLTKRKVYNRLIILLIYVMVTWFYMDKIEIYYRNKLFKGEESLEQETSYPQEPGPVFTFIYDIIEKLNPSKNIFCPYHGWTFDSFGKLKTLPLKNNFELLEETIKLNDIKNVVQVNRGLGDKEDFVGMFADGSASFLSDKRQEKVEVTTIDSFVDKNNLNIGLIKMDLEGYEFKAVKGAASTIKRFKPLLLISIYHNEKDFFEIKPLIEKIVKNEYEFKIRKLNPFHPTQETMLIFIPKVKLPDY